MMDLGAYYRGEWETEEVEEANTADDAIKFLPQTGSRGVSFVLGFGIVLGGMGMRQGNLRSFLEARGEKEHGTSAFGPSWSLWSRLRLRRMIAVLNTAIAEWWKSIFLHP